MKTIFVGNLPSDTTEQELVNLFSDFGRVRSSRLAQDVFTHACRGFGFIEMEGHEARAAIAGLQGKELRGKLLKVNEERPKNKGKGGRRRRH
ncbi:MAG: RNA-binding protein [Candidatus Competibacteraceae bacterium]|nr:RNA-binding protein [Candidatus Competibacteraceae bacterium]